MSTVLTINEPSLEVSSPSLAGLFSGQAKVLKKSRQNGTVVEPSKPGLDVENMTIDEAKRVLYRRRIRNGSACWPCRLRKIKCERKQPCENCVKRDHPQLCGYQPKRPTKSTVEPVSHSSLTSNVDTSAKNGSCKDASCSRPQCTQPPVKPWNRKRNLTKPSGMAPSSKEVEPPSKHLGWIDLAKQEVDIDLEPMRTILHETEKSPPKLPSDYEIFRLFQIYKEIPHLFWEFIVDIDDMELKIIAYLDKRSKTPRHSENGTSSWLALFYSILAVGVQYQDSPYHIRHEQSNIYTRAAFYFLHLNNALRKPKLVHIQALLLLSFVLLNNMEVPSSRAILDIAFVLARYIELHHEINEGIATEEALVDKDSRQRLWRTQFQLRSFISQFCGNCLYDSNIVVQPNHSIGDPKAAIASHLTALIATSPPNSWTYLQAMCHILQGLEQRFTSDPTQMIDLSQVLASCEMFESMRDKLAPYLRDRAFCKTENDYLQHYSVNLHISLSIGICSRPVLWRASDGYLGSLQQQLLVDKCRENSKRTIEMFLAMNRLSIIPVRSWTFIQAALSSALLLAKITEGDANPAIRHLLGDLILALSDTVTEEQYFSPRSMQSIADVGILNAMSHALGSLKDLFNSSSLFKSNGQQARDTSATPSDTDLLSPVSSKEMDYALELDDILQPEKIPTMTMAKTVDEYLADYGHDIYMSEDIYKVMLDTDFYDLLKGENALAP